MPRRFRRSTPLRTLLATVLAAGVLATAVSSNDGAAAATTNPVTPGNFTGFAFDQCLAPESWKMDRWMENSPFTGVGIYISGNSRGCRNQPNLTPEWIAHQLANRWRLLPITLGPQASCSTHFPRYDDDPTISPDPTNNYAKARSQARAEAVKTVNAASALGIAAGSTLWYDLEGFDVTRTRCRESALRFLSAWTRKIHDLGFDSGVYSSAGSGIKMLDDARVNRPGAFALPDFIWIARWDGAADTSTSYIREDGWRPGGRVKQFEGGHNETWGGVTINIDRDFMDLGLGSRARPARLFCGDVELGLTAYPILTPTSAPKLAVRALQCLLRQKDLYQGTITGAYDAKTIAAVNAWQKAHGTTVTSRWGRVSWVQLLSAGAYRTVKYGMSGGVVRRLQRALVAATGADLPATGVFFGMTQDAVKLWQGHVGLSKTGVMNTRSWEVLVTGRWR